ncbi:MAG TPA: alpha-hydroxy-acid oxidizing protein [Saprospiraceae bacterium]|nr:alpha-hydroxy-acid oxidizing protein [Saprospiraceae bacterium]
MEHSIALQIQKEIYTGGMMGNTPVIPADFQTLENKAKSILSKKAFAYIAGGAGMQNTVKNNTSAFSSIFIQPRMLRDASSCDMSVSISGKKQPFPFLLCPIGVLELAHKDADMAVGRAASKEKIPFIFSNQASVSMEKVSQTMNDGTRWFQLYWSKSDDLVKSLVHRAEQCGCEAIVVTCDTTLLGWRPMDLNLAYLPFLEGKGIDQYTSDPIFQSLVDAGSFLPPSGKTKANFQGLLSLIRLNVRYPGSFIANLRSGKALRAVSTFTNIYSNPALSWKEVEKLKKMTDLPIFLKGINHVDDAKKASDHGVSGIIISNHGGRQVDGAIATALTIKAIRQITKDRLTLLVDSGIRGGSDIFKALALGADAVCIGRPYVYGLAIAGEEGVRQVIRNLIAEFELTMRLSGCNQISDINENMITQSHESFSE